MRIGHIWIKHNQWNVGVLYYNIVYWGHGSMSQVLWDQEEVKHKITSIKKVNPFTAGVQICTSIFLPICCGRCRSAQKTFCWFSEICDDSKILGPNEHVCRLLASKFKSNTICGMRGGDSSYCSISIGSPF